MRAAFDRFTWTRLLGSKIGFLCAVIFCCANLAYAGPSSECPTPESFTVAASGSHPVDLSDCSIFGLDGVPVPPSHGSLTGVNYMTGNGTSQFTYVNNGDGALSDTFTVYDDSNGTIVFNVTVQAAVSPPVLTTSNGSTAFTAGDNVASTPVVIDSGITVTDASASTMVSGTVSITGNFQSGEDVLAFTNDGSTMGDIGASYSAILGVLTLTSAGASTTAQWQNALASVTYTDTAVTPNNATRTISFVVNDGTDNSNTATKNVTVADTDQTPIVITTGGSTAFTAGDNAASTPVVIDSGLTISDLDNATLASGTVSITGNFQFLSGEDVLAFTNDGSTMGNISAVYTSGTGVLALSSSGATATVAQWQAALASVTYTDTAVTPNNATRTISFVVNDGTDNSNTATKNVTVADTDQTPIVTTSGGSTAFTAGDNGASTPVDIDSGLTISDSDNVTLASGTVSITSNLHSAEDALMFTNNPATMGNVSGSYTAGTGVLALSSSGATATLAQWQAALRSVTYTDSAITPNNDTRTISFVVSDGTDDSSAATKNVTVADTDQTPIVITSGGTTGWTESNSLAAMSTPVVIDASLTVSDLDNTTLASGTVSIGTGFQSGEDVLAFTNDGSTMGNISAVYTSGTGVLALSSSGETATLAQWQAALRAVTYNDTSQPPTGASRTISFVVNDGLENSTAATKSVSLTTVNHPPIFTLGSLGPWPSGTSGLEDVPGFAVVTNFGQTGESGQAVMAYHVTDMTDTEGVISGGSSGILIQNDGTLVYSLSGQSGTATISVQCQDNGGTSNGGNDTSAAQTFTITVGNGWDLSISMDDNTNGKNFFDGGGLADYTITVQNIGSSDAHGATVQDTLPSNLLSASWTCEAITTATCTASGTGDISDTVSIPKNSAVIYHLTATVQADPEDPVSNTATVATAAGETDIDLSNNTTTIVDTVGVFTDGFESFGKSLIRDMTVTANKAQTQVVTLDASHEILKPQPLLIARIHDSVSSRMAEVHLRQYHGQAEVRLSWRGDDGLWQPGAWHVLTNPSQLALAWSTEAGSQHDWPLAEVEITQGNTTISRVGIDP